MKKRFWLINRRGVFYAHDSQSNTRHSLRTRNSSEARRLIQAKNDAHNSPTLNIALAAAYLTANDPHLATRTWMDVMKQLISSCQKASTRERVIRGMKSSAFDPIRSKRLIETTSEDFLGILKGANYSTCHYLRMMHNLALGLGWIHRAILPPKLWPQVKVKPKKAITLAEHRRIIDAENNRERRLYYQLLWETGASQSDAAQLTHENIDWKSRTLTYHRQKLEGRNLPPACLAIGPSLASLLDKLPSEGCLFPTISKLSANHRAAEFRRRCRLLGIDGVSLHSYRRSFAERASQLGIPERLSMAALGHSSKAVHHGYAKGALVVCPALEEYDKMPGVHVQSVDRRNAGRQNRLEKRR